MLLLQLLSVVWRIFFFALTLLPFMIQLPDIFCLSGWRKPSCSKSLPCFDIFHDFIDDPNFPFCIMSTVIQVERPEMEEVDCLYKKKAALFWNNCYANINNPDSISRCISFVQALCTLFFSSIYAYMCQCEWWVHHFGDICFRLGM